MDWYSEQFVQTGRAPAVWALFGFLVTFAITRWITRRIRTKNAQPKPLDAEQDGGKGGFSDIYIGGVHVHHQVWGIMLVLVTGLLEFRFNPESPWSEVLAALFGAGAALVLDEFALWFHLDDVYWGEAGRKSIDAILIGGALGFVLLLQANPFGVDESIDEPGTWGYYLDDHLQHDVCGALLPQGQGRHRPDRHPDPAGVADRRHPTRQADVALGAASLSGSPRAPDGALAPQIRRGVGSPPRPVARLHRWVARSGTGTARPGGRLRSAASPRPGTPAPATAGCSAADRRRSRSDRRGRRRRSPAPRRGIR